MARVLRRVLPTALAALAPLAPLISAATPSASAAKLPPVKHVWIIMLENENYNYTFGSAGRKFSPYLAETLPTQGNILKDYYGTGHDSLDNYVASVSGQAGNYT